MKDLLLEIGVEELPARFVPGAIKSLEEAAKARLEAAGLAYENLKTLGTPRRLALLAAGVPEKTQETVQETLGPALAQARTTDGNWTPAAQGFARSQGTTPDRLAVKSTERGERLCALRKTAGRPAVQVLPELL